MAYRSNNESVELSHRYYLSVVIPTYNRRDALEITVDSVLDQEALSDEIEILIADNCSSDGTEELVRRKYDGKKANLTYIRRKENIGPDNNFAESIKESSGDYVKLLNDNKPFKPGALANILSILRESSPAVLLTTSGARYAPEHAVVSTFDLFVDKASYTSTWLAGICFKKDLWESIANKELGKGAYLIQTYFLFEVLRQDSRAVIDNKVIFGDVEDDSPKGGYNLFKVFVENYLSLLHRYVDQKLLSKRTYRKERRRVLNRFVIPRIFSIVEDPGRYRLDLKGWRYYLLRYYWNDPVLYALPLLIAMRIIKRLVGRVIRR